MTKQIAYIQCPEFLKLEEINCNLYDKYRLCENMCMLKRKYYLTFRYLLYIFSSLFFLELIIVLNNLRFLENIFIAAYLQFSNNILSKETIWEI